MVDRDQILKALEDVMDPEIRKSLVELNMIRGIDIQGSTVKVTIVLTVPGCPLKAQIKRDVEERLLRLAGIERVEVEFGSMSDEERGNLSAKLKGSRPTSPLLAEGCPTRIIGVASGKGGVGKSTVTVNLAVALAKLDYKVGLIDADIYGYSIPRMLGLEGRPVMLDEKTILPMEAYGVKAISIGNLVDEDTPIIWRGPLLGKMLEQFLNDVYWGDLDYLLLDLPPGTGDMALSVQQMIPRSELVIVTTPQAASANVASRVGNFAKKTNQKVIGVVENMAYFLCPHCGEATEVFGRGGGLKLSEAIGVPLLGRVPLTTDVRQGGDEGEPIAAVAPDSAAGEVFREVARRVQD